MLAVYLQQSRGYSPLTVGFAFIPFAVALGLANLAAGRFVARWGSRGPILAGLALALAGFALLFAAGPHTPYGLLLPALIVLPSGIGVAVPAMTSALLGEIPRERSGVASGVLNTVRQAAGALGVAVTAALLARAGLASGMLWATALFTLLFAAAIVLTLTGIAPATGTKAA
jgi:DHA2 family methylenomycin A resistance protein-like MFS transporter